MNPDTHASPHFAWREFACHNWQRTAYPADWRDSRGRPLANELEAIRAWLTSVKGRDMPLHLNSVYRTSEWNKACCGVPRSQHLQGRACDVRCPFGCTFDEFRDAVIGIAGRELSRIRYIKAYKHQGFIHLDIRPTTDLVIEEADV